MTGFAFTLVLKSTLVKSSKVASAIDFMKYMVEILWRNYFLQTNVCFAYKYLYILLKGKYSLNDNNNKDVEEYYVWLCNQV